MAVQLELRGRDCQVIDFHGSATDLQTMAKINADDLEFSAGGRAVFTLLDMTARCVVVVTERPSVLRDLIRGRNSWPKRLLSDMDFVTLILAVDSFADYNVSLPIYSQSIKIVALETDGGASLQRCPGLWDSPRYPTPCPSALTEKRTLMVSYVGTPPFIVYEVTLITERILSCCNLNIVQDPLTGVDVELVRILGRQMGFEPRFKPSNAHGVRQKGSGKWTGMMGEVRVTSRTAIK